MSSHKCLQRISRPTSLSFVNRASTPSSLKVQPTLHYSLSRQRLPSHQCPSTRSNRSLPRRYFSNAVHRRKEQSSSTPTSETKSKPTITSYTFDDIKKFVENPDPNRIIIDVREPSELQASGRIPTALNVPIGSSPDFPFLPAEEFEDKFEIPRPDESKEVVFYCKAGVRSRAAARLAADAGFGGKIGEFPGSWLEWEGKGGKIQR